MNETKPIPSRPVPAAADCWHTIGVLGGDRSCAELERHTHCRNCPVFAEAGARLLDRALPAGYREEWTRRLAEAKTAAAAKKSVVVFRVGPEWLALPTPVFQEVAERRVIRPLPHQNNFVLGLVSVRGELLICISLAGLLGPEAEIKQSTRRAAYDRLLVVGQRGQRLAFPVDEVLGVQRFLPAEVTELPASITQSAANLTRGVLKLEGRAVGLLDADLFFATLNRNFS